MATRQLDVPVEFGTVNIGEETASIGIRVSREAIDLDEADEFFAGRRVDGEVKVMPKDSAAGQKQINGALPHVATVFDVKRFGCNAKDVTARLTFALESIDVTELAQIAKRSGRVAVDLVGDLAEQEGGDDE